MDSELIAVVMGVIHNDLAGSGELGENGGVKSALIDSEHRNAVQLGQYDIFRHQVGKGKGLYIRFALLAGTQAEFFDIRRGFFFDEYLHNIGVGYILLRRSRRL